MSGELPSVYPESECLCPEGFPVLLDTDPLFCTLPINTGYQRTLSRFQISFRGATLAYMVPEAITDRQTIGNTYWLSQPGKDYAEITVEFPEPALVCYCIL